MHSQDFLLSCLDVSRFVSIQALINHLPSQRDAKSTCLSENKDFKKTDEVKIIW